MRKELRAVRRVWGSRWFSGFATAIVLLGAFAAAGLSFGGVGESAASHPSGAGQIRVKFPWLPDPDRGGEWIEIESFQWGIQGSSTRPPSGPPSVRDVIITKPMDASSLRLHEALARGEHFPEVTIELCRQDCNKTKYMVVTLKDALIVNYSVSDKIEIDPMGGLPMETIAINYGKIELTYHAQDKKNELTGTLKWDCTSWPGCVPY